MAKRPAPAPAPRPKKTEPVHHIGEPERVCANCEHFDGGGLKADGTHDSPHGDCHNGISGKFQTHAKDLACLKGFYPCTTRWPLEKRYHGG